MGLSIHYNGRIKQAASLPALIEEVKDISEIYGWKYHIYETEFPNNSFDNCLLLDPVYGISFTPTASETISLAFLSNGVMVCPARINFFANSESETERSFIFINSVKTQYAGVVIHQLIIHLFKYLDRKYLQEFQLTDESEYWETLDEALMKRKFKLYNELVDGFASALQSFPMEANEDLQTYFNRLIQYVNRLKRE